MLEAFWLSLGVVFVAELGDKSQLMAMAFATRYRASQVLIGIAMGAGLMFAAAVAVGALAAEALPERTLRIVAGIAFLGFALWTLRGDDDHEEAPGTTRLRSPILAVAGAFLIAELGDKTMLAVITLAGTENPWGVWVGASVGMLAADALAIVVGNRLASKIPEKTLRHVTAGIFAVFGIILLIDAIG